MSAFTIPLEFHNDIRHAKETIARYRQTGDLGALDEAAAAWRRIWNHPAFAAVPLAFRLATLNDGGGVFWQRYQVTGQLADLTTALRCLEAVVTQTPEGSPNLPDYLNNLGISLREHYARSGDLKDLVQAIVAFEQAVAQTPEGSPNLPARLNNLSNGLSDRYACTGDFKDLVQAIEACEQAITQTPEDSPNLPGYLNNLGAGLRARYTCCGDLKDLEQAIAACEKAVAQTPDGSPGLPMYLNSLGVGLMAHYACSGDLADLMRAIRAFEQAVAQMPQGAPNLPMYLNSLGNSLKALYARSGDLANLVRAIEACEQAIARTPKGAPGLPMYLNNLGGGLGDRYAHTGAPAYLTRAIEAFEQAVALTPEDAPDLPGYLNNLGKSLGERYARTGDLTDLARAIDVCEQAVARTSHDSPNFPMYLNNLGNGLKERYAHSGDLADLTQAMEAYQGACQRGQKLAPEETLRAARNWGNWALERGAWAEAARAYAYGLAASEGLFRAQLLRASKEAWLRAAPSLHAHAAYALALAGDLSHAVETLEAGRARLLAQALERDRTDLAQLEMVAQAAHQKYVAAAERLQTLEAQEIGSQAALPPGRTLADAIRQARADLDVAVEAIRCVPGYQDFLRPLTFAQIQAAAGVEALVYLATTPVGGLALVVHGQPCKSSEPSQGSAVLPLRLGGLNEDALQRQLLEITEDEWREMAARLERDEETEEDLLKVSKGYLGAYTRWRAISRDDTAAHAAWLAALDDTARWLWDAGMGQLVEMLRSLGVKRAALVPQGWLGLLPLHAAWTDTGRGGGRRYALDDVCFTYAPNARALRNARQTAARVAPDSLFAVFDPNSSLLNSAQEVAAACACFAPNRRKTLGGEAAAKEAVAVALAGYTVLHFSCHGQAGFDEPLAGGLLLASSERLTLREVLALRLENARLAVLSACETGIPGLELPDEVVSLPAGLAQAGVAGVVASLWSVSDLSTTLLMARFYELWQVEGIDPAEALRQAQCWLRDTTNSQKAAFLNRLPLVDREQQLALLSRAEENDFAHPFHWAAFGYTGV